jgi:hypothetical protein
MPSTDGPAKQAKRPGGSHRTGRPAPLVAGGDAGIDKKIPRTIRMTNEPANEGKVLFYYHIHFIVGCHHGTSEHTRVVVSPYLIEYESDIELLQQWAAKEVGAESAMVVSWRELKGLTRSYDTLAK